MVSALIEASAGTAGQAFHLQRLPLLDRCIDCPALVYDLLNPTKRVVQRHLCALTTMDAQEALHALVPVLQHSPEFAC